MTITIRNHSGREHALLAVKTHTSELNGSDTLDLKIAQQRNNNLDLLSIDKLWEIEYNNIDYKITRIKKQTRGKSFDLNVGATPLFFWEFSKSIIHENHDGSHTANSAFRIVFENTGFNFVLVDFSPAVSWEGFGKGSTRLEMFKRLIDRYNYEFEIQGKTVYMRHRIGNDTNFMYKYKLNASNVSSTTDANGYFTYIRGFGDFEEGEEDYWNNAKLKREYTHPLADVVGEWEGKPVVDGRISNQDTMDARMHQAVEDSLQVTVEGTLHDVRKMGYTTAVPVKGDRVWLHDERINLEQEIRLHKIVTTYDEKDNITGCDVTFGSQSISERHKANINSLSKRFADLLTGQLKLPVISLEKIGMDMINAIHAASSEIIFGDFGMQAISKTNPNHVFGLNSEGWYISQDGGRTPRTIATAQGIYADAIFAGTLWLTNDLNIEGVDGYLNIASQRITMKNHDGTDSTIIEPGRIRMNRSDFELGGGADMHFLDSLNTLYYERGGRTSGLGVGYSLVGELPYVFLGAVESGRLQTSEARGFSGFIANTRQREINDGIQNSVNGDNFQIRDNVTASAKNIEFELNSASDVARIIPWNTHLYHYHLGYENQLFARAYINGLYTGAGAMFIRNQNNEWEHQGWRLETAYGDSSYMTLRGINSADFFNLGAPGWRFSHIYSVNPLNVSSDERLKGDIKDNELGLEFIKKLKTKSYRMKNSPTSDRPRQYGILAQNVLEALEAHGVDTSDINMVSEGEDGFYGAQYEQFDAPIIRAIQELAEEVEALKQEIELYKKKVEKLEGETEGE